MALETFELRGEWRERGAYCDGTSTKRHFNVKLNLWCVFSNTLMLRYPGDFIITYFGGRSGDPPDFEGSRLSRRSIMIFQSRLRLFSVHFLFQFHKSDGNSYEKIRYNKNMWINFLLVTPTKTIILFQRFIKYFTLTVEFWINIVIINLEE